MTGIFITIMTVILILAILVMIAVVGRNGDEGRDNDPFINEDGDHVYYDRKLIEMKRLKRRRQDVKGDRHSGQHFGNKPEKKP